MPMSRTMTNCQPPSLEPLNFALAVPDALSAPTSLLFTTFEKLMLGTVCSPVDPLRNGAPRLLTLNVTVAEFAAAEVTISLLADCTKAATLLSPVLSSATILSSSKSGFLSLPCSGAGGFSFLGGSCAGGFSPLGCSCAGRFSPLGCSCAGGVGFFSSTTTVWVSPSPVVSSANAAVGRRVQTMNTARSRLKNLRKPCFFIMKYSPFIHPSVPHGTDHLTAMPPLPIW